MLAQLVEAAARGFAEGLIRGGSGDVGFGPSDMPPSGGVLESGSPRDVDPGASSSLSDGAADGVVAGVGSSEGAGDQRQDADFAVSPYRKFYDRSGGTWFAADEAYAAESGLDWNRGLPVDMEVEPPTEPVPDVDELARIANSLTEQVPEGYIDPHEQRDEPHSWHAPR